MRCSSHAEPYTGADVHMGEAASIVDGLGTLLGADDIPYDEHTLAAVLEAWV